LAVILLAIGAVLLLLFIGGLMAAARRRELEAPDYLRHVAEADGALEEARAADRGWDREVLEAEARRALETARPGWSYEDLHLVLVDDRPGVNEDAAHFLAMAGDDQVRVVLARQDSGWTVESVA